jgi:hypothetical protein
LQKAHEEEGQVVADYKSAGIPDKPGQKPGFLFARNLLNPGGNEMSRHKKARQGRAFSLRY